MMGSGELPTRESAGRSDMNCDTDMSGIVNGLCFDDARDGILDTTASALRSAARLWARPPPSRQSRRIRLRIWTTTAIQGMANA